MKNLLLSLAAVGLWATGVSCTSNGTGQTDEGRDRRFYADAGEDIVAGEGDVLTLRAKGVNGRAPYIYRWNVERTPEGADEVALTDGAAAQTTTSALTTQGRYLFRVVVVDASGRDAYAFVAAEVGPPGTGTANELKVTIEGPSQVSPGGSGQVWAVVDSVGDFTYSWEVVTDHDVTFETPDRRVTNFTVNDSGSIVVRVTVRDEAANAVGAAEFTILSIAEGALTVTVSGLERVEVDQLVQVAASVTNANGDVTYAWTVADGAAELSNETAGTVSVRPTAAGRLAVQVEVTDDFDGATASAEYVVTVDAASSPLNVQAIGPDILNVLEPTPVSVEFEGQEDADEITYAWEVAAGDAVLDDPAAAEPALTARRGETIQLRVEVTVTAAGATRVGAAELFVVSIVQERPEVEFAVTDFGDIVFELRPDLTPKTVANLLRYVDEGFYEGIVIHRVVPDFVIQAGGFEVDEDGELVEVEVRDGVESEAAGGLSNVRGNVAMALRGGNVDSGTSQWFINLVDNTSLDDQGFTAFGTVVEGMDVVDAIAEVETGSRSGLSDVPLEDIFIASAGRRSAQAEPLNVSVLGLSELGPGSSATLTAQVDPRDDEHQVYFWEVIEGELPLLTPTERTTNTDFVTAEDGPATVIVRVTVANRLSGAIGTGQHTINILGPG